MPEMAHPYAELVNTADIVVASPKGGKAPLDSESNDKSDEVSQKFLKEKIGITETTEKLSSFIGKADEFAAIFYVGGHGPMYDLAHNETSHSLIKEFADKGKVVSAVCHGPAALAYAKLSSGEYLIKDSEVTGFSNTEEDTVGKTQYMPFSLEDVLAKNSGGNFSKAKADWGSHVKTARGGKLITGQNPASAADVGKAILKAIGA